MAESFLNQSRLEQSEIMRTAWFATVPAGTKPEDLLKPEFWSQAGHKLKPLALVDAAPEDMAWYAQYVVVSADRLWAKLHLLSSHDLSMAKKDMPARDDEKYEVKWKGPMSKHAVIRKSDGAMLKDNFTTMGEAWQWLDGHISSLAA
jgi:hypothetical protein